MPDSRFVADIIPVAGGYLATADVDGTTVNAIGTDVNELTRNLVNAVAARHRKVSDDPGRFNPFRVVEMTLALMTDEEMRDRMAQAGPPRPIPMPPLDR